MEKVIYLGIKTQRKANIQINYTEQYIWSNGWEHNK